MELRLSGLPESANRTSRTSEHPGLDRDQRRRRSLVPDQRVARSAPAIDRDTAASSQGRQASPQPDSGRDPDQWRNRCGRRPVVDARRLAVYDLRARQGACDPQGQQHLQCAEREERARASRSRLDKAFEPALPDGSPSGIEILPFAVPGKGAWYLEGKAHPGGDDGAGDTLGLRIGDKATRQVFLFSRRLRRRHGRSEIPAGRRAAGLLRWHGVARRRVDRRRARQQDRARHGTYCDVGRSRRDRSSLAGLDIGRKIFLHINNSNPALLHGSAERKIAERAGWQIPPTERRSRCERHDHDSPDG